MTYQDKKYKALRQKLRSNPTDAERKLWSILKNKQALNCKFTRQYGVENFILDFYCPSLRLAIELDGGQHMQADHKTYDENRTAFLKSKNIQVLRFFNSDVFNNIESVKEKIYLEIVKMQNIPS